jgi:hypothetical protein
MLDPLEHLCQVGAILNLNADVPNAGYFTALADGKFYSRSSSIYLP